VSDVSCIFCKIIRGEIKSPVIYENEHIFVIQDIHPKAPIHYLIMPKKHLENMLSITPNDNNLCWEMFAVAQELGSKLPSKAFNIIANNGASAGQSVFHLHWHFLAGKNLYEHGLHL